MPGRIPDAMLVRTVQLAQLYLSVASSYCRCGPFDTFSAQPRSLVSNADTAGYLVNIMATNLTDQVREIAEVTTAVAQGDLGKKIQRPARGEILQLQQTM